MESRSQFKIKKAEKKSLKEIAAVIEDSIVNLCQKDHLNQRQHLDAWLAERSEENLEKILFNRNAQAFVCTAQEDIVGVALIENTGNLKLCYVHSKYIGKGIGRLLLEAVEQQARNWGLSRIKMISTNTARNFYLSQGYIQNGEQILCIGMPGYPLEKKI